MLKTTIAVSALALLLGMAEAQARCNLAGSYLSDGRRCLGSGCNVYYGNSDTYLFSNPQGRSPGSAGVAVDV